MTARRWARRLTKKTWLVLVAIALPTVMLAAALRADQGNPGDSPIDSAADSNQSQVESTAAADSPTATEGEAMLSGRILDESGMPVTDATVELTGTRARARDILDHFEAKTDAQGRYRFEKVNASGEFSLRVTSTQWVGITDWKSLPRVRLTPMSRIEKDFTLELACQIGVSVVDEAGQPVQDAQLYAGSVADEMPGNRNEARTSRFGSANIGGLKPANVDYLLGVYHQDFGYAKALVKLREPGAIAVEKIVMSKGVDVPGTAICSDGKPAAGWKVYALPSWWRFGVSHRGAEIGNDGKFLLTHIVPDAYDLNVHIPSGGGTSRVEVAAAGMQLPLETGVVELRLRTLSPQSMTYIAGKIRYHGKQPQNGFWIFSNSMDRQEHASVHVDAGATDFRIGPVPPGKYRVNVDDTRIDPLDDLGCGNAHG